MEQTSHKARRQREIETQREAILEATRQLARQNGWPKVSIRKIADIVQYTPPLIYEHFKNKEALLIELEAVGFGKLRRTLDEARQRSGDPVLQLVALAEAYWEWAFAHAELYQVMFNLEGVQATSPRETALREAGPAVTETLRQLVLFSGPLDELFFNWWAMCHGHVCLIMSGHLQGHRSAIRQALLSGTERFAQGLR